MKGAQLNPKKTPRIAAAAAMVVSMLVAVAALGGVGRAQSMITAADGAYGKKVTICHKGKTITVGKAAVAAHVKNHGDTIGTCAQASAKKAKAAKAKAAKAAKAKAEAAKAKGAEKKAEKQAGNPGKGKGGKG
jgi:hypothetical protein